MKKKIVSTAMAVAMIVGCLPITANASTSLAINSTNFPDEVFQEFLSDYYDDNNDGSLSPDEIAAVDYISLIDRDVTSLVGIKNFKNLELLICSDNARLTSLDVSGLTMLEEILCDNCNLSTLNISGCTGLEVLDCEFNNIGSIDLRGMKDLYDISVAVNPLTKIYIGDSPELCDVYCCDCKPLTFEDGTIGGYQYEDPYSFNVIRVDLNDTIYGCTQRKPNPMPSLPAPSKSAGDFVTRCYTVALGRNPDTAGYNNWLNNLNAGKACGGQVAYGFIFSQEYINKNKSNEAFVGDLYQMFFGRARGSGEGQAWINELNAGVKNREQVFNGFVNSTEFFNLCKEYGITAGYYVSGVSSTKQGGVNCFVERLYEVCLGRRSDIGGQQNWASALMAGSSTGSSCVHGFLFSTEFTNKNLNDADFVAYTYRAFFGREADISGLTTWVNYLGNGGTREGVFNGFVNSQEFRNLCSSYGINP